MWLHCVGYYNCFRTDLNIFILDNRSLPIYFVYVSMSPHRETILCLTNSDSHFSDRKQLTPDGVIHVRISVQVFNSCYL